MARPYYLLRRKMQTQGVTCADIAREIGVSRQAISNKLRNVSTWTLDDIWKIMGILSIDPSKMALYFPCHGHNE